MALYDSIWHRYTEWYVAKNPCDVFVEGKIICFNVSQSCIPSTGCKLEQIQCIGDRNTMFYFAAADPVVTPRDATVIEPP